MKEHLSVGLRAGPERPGAGGAKSGGAELA
jgi:hypothetical protein